MVRPVQSVPGMLRRAPLVALVALVATSGCTMSKQGRSGTIVAGLGISAASMLVIASGANDSNHDGTNETFLNDDWDAYATGTVLLLTGIGVLVAGLASDVEPDPVTYLPPASAYPLPPAPVVVEATRTVEITRVPVVPLPELPATADVLRLAKQVRSASTTGRCDAAWIMWTDLQRLDRAYAIVLRDGPVMARCAM